MSVFFAFAGVFIAVKQFLPPPPPVGTIRWEFFHANPWAFNVLIGALLFSYGVFRFVRSWRIIRHNNLDT
jgi:hypothetical protein